MYKRNKNVKSGASIRARFQASQKKKTAPETLPRKTDLSATRVEPAASTPTRTQSPVLAFRQRALEARRKREAEKKAEAQAQPTRPQSPVMASRQRSLEARRKREAEKAKEKESAKAKQTAAKSKEPKRRANESITAFRQRLAKYRRENKS